MTFSESQLRHAIESLRPGAEAGPGLDALADLILRVIAGSDLGEGTEEATARSVVNLHGRLSTRVGDGPMVFVEPVEAVEPVDSGLVGIDIIADDCTFIVDSVLLAIREHGQQVRSMFNAVVGVERDANGTLLRLDAPDQAGAPVEGLVLESVIHLEIDDIGDPESREHLRSLLIERLASVAVVANSSPEMAALMQHAASELSGTDPQGSNLLAWLADNNLLLFGAVTPEGTHGLCSLENWVPLPALDQRFPGVMFTESKRHASIHRHAPLLRVSVWLPEQDRREEYFGLFPAHVYALPIGEVPVVGERVEAVVARAGFLPGGHNQRQMRSLLESYPREELFQIDSDGLFGHAMAMLNLRNRHHVRILERRSPSDRFVSLLCFIPREQFDTGTRRLVVDAVADAYGSDRPSFAVSVGDSPFARLHVKAHSREGERLAAVDTSAFEKRVTELTERWPDRVGRALETKLGAIAGAEMAREWGAGFSSSYQEERTPAQTVVDVTILATLEPDDLAVELWTPDGATEFADELRVTLYRSGGPLILSEILPLLQDLGMTVLDEHPYELCSASGKKRWIYDVGVRAEGGAPTVERRENFEAALGAVWQGDADSDGFGRLVLSAGLTWRDAAVLRAYRRYLRQIGSTFSQAYYEQTLVGNPEIVRLLATYFHARFNPAFQGSAQDRAAAEAELSGQIDAALEGIASLDEDRMLRSFRMLIAATVRTNAFVADAQTLAFKIDPTLVEDLPAPVPAHEIWVHAPRIEGVHLRGGDVARGGLRHSDRLEDFRTEVLGLMKAQQVKNSVIVPVGAKGGFVCQRLPVGADRSAVQAEVVDCYRMFITALLEVTDNIADTDGVADADAGGVGPTIVPAVDVVRHDGDDPYLVVAADKGTATFSDYANAVSVERGFWLGDAFASGGSTGYDHKAMGITAKGAWESVRRHLYEIGIDSQTDPVRTVGIGDMSGDVFGNGMLLSPTLEVVAAFDHRHIFLDPNPDPTKSFAERRRLFDLPRSSWDDYDRTQISAGGGVFARTTKAITVGREVADALACEPGDYTPNELMRAILMAPVEVFWNGGIGTFFKATDETHLEVGDRTNDAIRLDASQVRCRVIGEGGNLGLTQRARIEMAQAGVAVNTDAIDNSAGVDTSDHEVNLKVLTDQLVAEGSLDVAARNELLASMTEEVAEQVLVDNVEQNLALSLAQANAGSMIDVHIRLMRRLEADVGLDRHVEFLPTDDALAERGRNGKPLTRPELAVLLAYEKNWLTDELTASGIGSDPSFGSVLADYFPPVIRTRYPDRLASHPLAGNIVATAVTNQMVNRVGMTMVGRLGEETGATPADIVRAHRVAWQAFDIEAQWAALIESGLRRNGGATPPVSSAEQVQSLLALRQLAERATRWLLRHRSDLSDPGPIAQELRAGIEVLAVSGSDTGAVSQLDQVDLAAQTGIELERVAEVWHVIGERLDLNWLSDQVTALDRRDHWDAMARGAARNEVADAQRSLVASVLASESSGDTPIPTAAMIDSWMGRNGGATDRYRALLANLRSSDSVELAHLTVAVSELRDVLRRL